MDKENPSTKPESRFAEVTRKGKEKRATMDRQASVQRAANAVPARDAEEPSDTTSES
jgi:hypothetical protein